jgi:hypothetical protein
MCNPPERHCIFILLGDGLVIVIYGKDMRHFLVPAAV